MRTAKTAAKKTAAKKTPGQRTSARAKLIASGVKLVKETPMRKKPAKKPVKKTSAMRAAETRASNKQKREAKSGRDFANLAAAIMGERKPTKKTTAVTKPIAKPVVKTTDKPSKRVKFVPNMRFHGKAFKVAQDMSNDLMVVDADYRIRSNAVAEIITNVNAEDRHMTLAVLLAEAGSAITDNVMYDHFVVNDVPEADSITLIYKPLVITGHEVRVVLFTNLNSAKKLHVKIRAVGQNHTVSMEFGTLDACVKYMFKSIAKLVKSNFYDINALHSFRYVGK